LVFSSEKLKEKKCPTPRFWKFLFYIFIKTKFYRCSPHFRELAPVFIYVQYYTVAILNIHFQLSGSFFVRRGGELKMFKYWV
jgi:hypothetical protein